MGIIEEGQDVMKELKARPPWALVSSRQPGRSSTMKSPATAREDGGSRARLKSSNEVAGTTLAEEKKTDETLTQLAENQVNQHAQAA
jgi:hypothetical protein